MPGSLLPCSLYGARIFSDKIRQTFSECLSDLMSRYLTPRLRDVLFLAILVSALALGPRMLNLDSDLGRHLTLGRYILETHHIPIHDLFSHSRAGDARPAYEWVTQVIFASAEKLAGLDGPLFVTALCIAAAFTIVQADSTRRNRLPLTALTITALAVSTSSLHWLPRPHVITFLLLAIWLDQLEKIRAGESIPLWHFPFLMLIWVNAHGGFVFGMLAWVAYVAGWIWERGRKSNDEITGKRLLLIGGLSLVATFISPGFWGNWKAVLGNHSQFILSRTIETMPPSFTQPGTWPFAMMVVLSIIIILATRKTISISHIFLLAGFATLGLLMARNIPLYAITAAPILSMGARDVLYAVKRWRTIEANIAALESQLRGTIWPILFSLGLALFIGGCYQFEKRTLAHFDERIFPVSAADWLEEHPQSGNMFNEFNWGGYLLYRLWPEQKVFLDSQTDFYGEGLLREYQIAMTIPDGWKSIFIKYNVEWVILPPDSVLGKSLNQNSGWDLLYTDLTAIIIRRK